MGAALRGIAWCGVVWCRAVLCCVVLCCVVLCCVIFQEMEEVREAFQLFDTEQKGSIDIKELKAGFRALGFQVRLLFTDLFLRDLYT